MGKQLSLLMLLFFPILAMPQQSSLVLRHVTVVDVVNGQLLKNMSVVIHNNYIADIGIDASVPEAATVINAKGKYLIPGLWDMHVHLSYYGEDAFAMLVANGITGVRDMGGNLSQIDSWRQEIASGALTGPRIKRAGPFIDGPKKMSSLRASFTKIPADENAARFLVDSLKAIGVDFLKIHSRVPHNIFFAVINEAKKQNIPVAVHLPKDVKPEEAVQAKVRSIEHTESLLGDVIYEEREDVRAQRTADTLKKLYGEYWKRLMQSIAGNKIFYDPTLISLYKVKGTDYEEMLAPKLLPLVRRLHEAKVTLLAGSDFGTKDAGIRPGYDLHDELVLFIQAGLTPLEALQTATINPAKCLYMSDSVGTVEKGKIADLVLLNNNPLQDISNTKSIYAVILNGKYLAREVLDEMMYRVETKAKMH